MALYVSSDRIRAALDRLSESRARPALSDFLACLRALTIEGAGDPSNASIGTGQNDRPFQTGLDDVALLSSEELDIQWPGDPFLFVFDGTRPFRGARHRSNGTADTISRWGRRDETPFQLTGSPRQLSLLDDLEGSNVANLVLKGSDEFPLPRGDDFAVWFYRYTDLSQRFSGDDSPTVADLVDGARLDLGLPESLWEQLFDTDQVQEDVFSPTPPSPQQFMAAAAPVVAGGGVAGEDLGSDVAAIHRYVSAKGFTVQPWQVAAFITAVRTKPFVILAGISGTGKTKLPHLVANATGSAYALVPVRPDWTDSADLLGYRTLTNEFRPGSLLELAQEAELSPDRQHFVMLDEMNIARVEYYLAEVLSHMEERERDDQGLIASRPLVPSGSEPWNAVRLTSNLCIVGSVNMDETTHGFARKVLDRAFVLEFSDIDLSVLGAVAAEAAEVVGWDADVWQQQYLRLAEYPDPSNTHLQRAIDVLTEVNRHLQPVQLQVGYRVRDEVALFLLNAQECLDAFVTSDDEEVDPLDLAIAMKILPRVQGGSAGISKALDGLLGWARGGAGDVAAFPVCAARLELMRGRYDDSGFTSFWL